MTRQIKISKEDLDVKLWSEVVRPVEVIRDPVHKDIGLTALELKIINTPNFLRLIALKQLGFAYLVYPGAVHNRFQHSLGTLHMANQIIAYCNQNAKKHPHAHLISPFDEFMIRLASLLHDLAHVPFGHTLDDEGNLFPPQWSDSSRSDVLKPIMNSIRDYLQYEYDIDNTITKKIVEELKEIILCKNPMDFKLPYIVDIVNNTICADLLDYVQRDIYNTGLNERLGDRFLRYLAILPLVRILDAEKKPTGEFGVFDERENIVYPSEKQFETHENQPVIKKRLVLMLYQYDMRKARAVSSRSALTESIDLIRKRYSLAEKVYFHRTKIAASAMIIAAVSSSGFTSKELVTKSDEELMHDLLNNTESEKSKLLVKNLKKRNLYKPIFKRGYFIFNEEDATTTKTLENVAERYRDKREREKLESQLEKAARIPEGSVVVYCPDRKMNLKHFGMLIQGQYGSLIKPLEDFVTSWIRDEIDVIKNRHKALWNFQIFVDPSVTDSTNPTLPMTKQIAGMCSAIIGLNNEIPQLQGCWRNPAEVIVEGAVREWDSLHPENKIFFEESEKLKNEAHRYGEITHERVLEDIKTLKEQRDSHG